MKRLLLLLSAFALSGCAEPRLLSTPDTKVPGRRVNTDFIELPPNPARDKAWQTVSRQLLKDPRFNAAERKVISSRKPVYYSISRVEAPYEYHLEWVVRDIRLVVKGNAGTLSDLKEAEIQRLPMKIQDLPAFEESGSDLPPPPPGAPTPRPSAAFSNFVLHNAVVANDWKTVANQLLKDPRFTPAERRVIANRKPDESITDNSTRDSGRYQMIWNYDHTRLRVAGYAKSLEELSHADIERVPLKRK